MGGSRAGLGFLGPLIPLAPLVHNEGDGENGDAKNRANHDGCGLDGSPVWGMNFVGGVGVEGFAGSSGLVYVLRNTQAASSSWFTLAMRLP